MATHQHTAGNHTRTCDYDHDWMRDLGMRDAFAIVKEVQELADRVTDVQTDVRQLIGAEAIRQELRAFREEVNGLREELREARHDMRAVMLAHDELQDDFVALRQRFEQHAHGTTHPGWAEHQPPDADAPEVPDLQSYLGAALTRAS